MDGTCDFAEAKEDEGFSESQSSLSDDRITSSCKECIGRCELVQFKEFRLHLVHSRELLKEFKWGVVTRTSLCFRNLILATRVVRDG